MHRGRGRTLDYFDDLMMSSDDATRQRHSRLGSESTVSSGGGEPWDDPQYIKCQQQCQTSGHRSARRFEAFHESFGNNPRQIEDDETSGMGSMSVSGSGSHRKYLRPQFHRENFQSQLKPLREYFGSREEAGWGYSLSSPERYRRSASAREDHRRWDGHQFDYPDSDPLDDADPRTWSEESLGGEAGNTVESIALRINKTYQYTTTTTASSTPGSPFAAHQENELQSSQVKLDPFSLHDGRPSRGLHLDHCSPEAYRNRLRAGNPGFRDDDDVANPRDTVVKNNDLFEYRLMPRIMPGEDQIEDFHKACLDSQPQSNCRTSLTLNSWLGETIDPTFTMESFTLSAKDKSRLSSGSIEFNVADQAPRAAASEVASMGSLGSWDEAEKEWQLNMFTVSKLEKKSAGIKQMTRFVDMDDVKKADTARSARKATPGSPLPEPPNDCTITCRPKSSKKRMVKAIRSFLCGRVGRRSLEKSWTDRDLKDLVAAQSGTEAIRPSLDRNRVVDSSSKEDGESSDDCGVLDTPRGHRGERFFIPEARSSQRPVQIISKTPTSRSTARTTEIKWKDVDPMNFQLSSSEWAKYWRFNGYWTLDKEMSDPQNLWQGSGHLTKAANKIDSLVIDSNPRICRRAFLADAVQLQEQMPWGGEIVNCDRRDRRMGYMLAWVERTRKGFITRMDWGDPSPTHLAESFELSKDGQILFSIQELERRDKPDVRSRTRSVYRRQG